MLSIAIVGGGVNGVCSAIALAEKGFDVTLYEKGAPFNETSSKSSKMLHGGIRYLEHGHIKLVKIALRERANWLKYAGEFTKVSRFFIPIFSGNSRSRIKLFAGAKLYQYLAGPNSLGASHYHSALDAIIKNPSLKSDGLLGAVSYCDVVMNDVEIAKRLLKNAIDLGVKIISPTKVDAIKSTGSIFCNAMGWMDYDFIVNAAGPWASELIKNSNLDSKINLDYLKGSHLVLNREIENPLVFQSIKDGRIIFLIPQGKKTLLGTTEIKTCIKNIPICTEEEMEYLLKIANKFLLEEFTVNDIYSHYSGIRPLVNFGDKTPELSSVSRECFIDQQDRLINIYGGKWTSAMELGNSVAKLIDKRKI